MKKLSLGLILAMFLVLSCTNGTAVPPDDNPQEGPVNRVADKGGDTRGQKEGKGKSIQLTKKDFLEKVMDYEKNRTEWVYEGDLPAVIDFYADWCGPCKIASPVLEEIAEEYEGRILVYKVDTDVEQELAAIFGIRSIPSFLFIPREGKPTMSNGIMQTPEATKAMFIKMIDDLLLSESAENL